MATNVAPPKNTGGGGFVFEDDVCAWLLATMLVGESVFGADCGAPVQVDFQTRPDGWFLDDVLVTTDAGATHHRFALSDKSNVQFTATSAPSASPGPFTTHPITATFIGTRISSANFLRTSCVRVNRST